MHPPTPERKKASLAANAGAWLPRVARHATIWNSPPAVAGPYTQRIPLRRKFETRARKFVGHLAIGNERGERASPLPRLLNKRAEVADGLLEVIGSALGRSKGLIGRSERLIRRGKSLFSGIDRFPSLISPPSSIFVEASETAALASLRFASVVLRFATVVSLKTSVFQLFGNFVDIVHRDLNVYQERSSLVEDIAHPCFALSLNDRARGNRRRRLGILGNDNLDESVAQTDPSCRW